MNFDFSLLAVIVGFGAAVIAIITGYTSRALIDEISAGRERLTTLDVKLGDELISINLHKPAFEEVAKVDRAIDILRRSKGSLTSH